MNYRTSEQAHVQKKPEANQETVKINYHLSDIIMKDIHAWLLVVAGGFNNIIHWLSKSVANPIFAPACKAECIIPIAHVSKDSLQELVGKCY